MASVIHIAEVAAVLAVAYGLGWAIGYAAHRVFALVPARAATVPAERLAAVTAAPDSDALVKAPVIDPVPSGPPPGAVKAAAVPPVAAEPVWASAPEPVTPGLTRIALPVTPPPPPLIIEPLPPRRKPRVDPNPPPPSPEPEVILTAAPAMAPGVAWSGEVRGRSASPITPVAVEPEIPAAEIVGEASEAPPAEIPMSIDLGPVGPDSTYGEPIAPEPLLAAASGPEEMVLPEPEPEPRPEPEPEPEPERASAPEPEPVSEPERKSAPELESEPAPAPDVPPVQPPAEDDAMRAIEGGWSRVRARALPGSPELSDVGAAVAAAQSAVEQVLAQAGIDAAPAGKAARPKGLPGARDGKKDDLKRINGLGSLDKSTLNNLGVFHFDQIAGWSAGQVSWMEDHVFARGRIGHENWQQQARDLAAAVTG